MERPEMSGLFLFDEQKRSGWPGRAKTAGPRYPPFFISFKGGGIRTLYCYVVFVSLRPSFRYFVIRYSARPDLQPNLL